MADERVVELGRLLADESRVALLDALADGRAYTVTELARHVGVARSTASEHLGRLLDGGLVAMEAQGRHRYYRLRGVEVADLLETLSEFGASGPVARSSRVPSDLAFARSCYDHLAGTVAVGLTDALVAEGSVHHDADTAGLVLTDRGRRRFADLGLDVHRSGDPPPGRRPLVRTCLDWSERRHHLAGAVPARLLDHMLDARWFLRRPGSRALQLTDAGRVGLAEAFDYTVP